jgi:hypothetical protein
MDQMAGLRLLYLSINDTGLKTTLINSSVFREGGGQGLGNWRGHKLKKQIVRPAFDSFE